jgi:hypothetical protein
MMGQSSDRHPTRRSAKRATRFSVLAGCILVLSVLLAACGARETSAPATEPGLQGTSPAAETPLATQTPAPTLEPTEVPTPTITPWVGPTPTGGAGRLAFSIVKRTILGSTSLGIFTLDISSGELVQMGEEGLVLWGVSPDARRLLVSQESELLVMDVDGANPVVISEQFFQHAEAGAYWPAGEETFAFIAQQEGENGVFTSRGDGVAQRRISAAGQQAVELYPTLDSSSVLWSSGSCVAAGECIKEGLHRSRLDGSGQQDLDSAIILPIASPSGEQLAFVRQDAEGNNGFYVGGPDGEEAERIFVGADHYLDYAWAPAGDWLALIATDRSHYSGRMLAHRYYLVSFPDAMVSNLEPYMEMASSLLWSPDGLHLIFEGTEQGSDNFRISVGMIDFWSMRSTVWNTAPQFSSTDFIYIPCMNWLP